MQYHPLGNTGLTVSVAGLGCGGNSRLGLGRGASFDECVGVARAAISTLMATPMRRILLFSSMRGATALKFRILYLNVSARTP